ncbi:subtilisin-like protease SBT5.3 isoform X2 [Juglans microcarpa x Juglans regia]|uniref:subtilisin-like protease SBT5.3 isoform X2 n=1 Tax=Juglans microcarpa x Juglans regia TaxID=2249226 RepID=UPI001B7EF989|nr:subtilisin-like protease SBT5.3 isoform X2 [Juglans microcarpa x Juglans regia]
MRLSIPSIYLLSFLLFSLLQPTTSATKKSYVVYLGAHSHGPEQSPIDFNRVTETHYEFLASFLGSHALAKESILYSYARHINGFAATFDDEVAASIAKHPKVVSVFLNKGRKLHTTRSWDFLGLEHDGVIASNSGWKKARYGEDTIIGNLDTGVWPESKSFSDEGLGPIPSKWKGICQNETDAGFHCNRKLIGARYCNKGYAAVAGSLNSSFDTPRDNDGHGSHTLSTAGGNFVAGASIYGFGKGTAKGGSPKARVAAYKVCWPPDECFDADIVAAFDMAIHDGVDVLSISLGGQPTPFFNDSVAIGSFHAVKHGIVVVCSAGNSGPKDGTVSNVAPWQITVGASTMDRQFRSNVILGNNMRLEGESLSSTVLGSKKFYPLVSAADTKAANASAEDASPKAYITRATTVLGTKPAPFMAAFSSKGPSTIAPEILKPDITAPGVSVIAAYTEAQGPTNQIFDERRVQFNSVSGTSMSCPHVSGIVGLLKTLHPTWSPAAIRSAIMTTAETQDNRREPILNASYVKATPFSYGAGHVLPNSALDPGLVYDLSINDYLDFICALGYNVSMFSDNPYKCSKLISLANLNYPSITIAKLSDSITVTRTLKNVGSPGTYRAHIQEPSGILVIVKPESLKFRKVDEEKSFNITLMVREAKASEDYIFGRLIWSDEKHFVKSPIVVKAV